MIKPCMRGHAVCATISCKWLHMVLDVDTRCREIYQVREQLTSAAILDNECVDDQEGLHPKQSTGSLQREEGLCNGGRRGFHLEN